MKLEHRLALLTAGVTAGTIAACLVTALILVRHSAASELDEEVIDGAKAAAVVVSEMELGKGTPIPSKIEIPEDVEATIRRLAVYSKEGNRIATRPEGADFPDKLEILTRDLHARIDKPFDLTMSDGKMRAVLVSRRRLQGMTLLHAVSRSQLDEVIAERARLFAGLFLATLGLIAFAARWLGRRLAADVNHVTAVARRVASGELSARAGEANLTSPETRNLARELDHMISELAAILAAQRNFVSYAAHELRSPLAALQGELQLALRRPRSAESYVETLGDALTEVAGLTQLTENLLTLAHAQAESTSMGHTRVGDLVDEALRLVQGTIQIQETSVQVEIASIADVTVCGSQGDLSRILRNLLENAVKFSPVGASVRLLGGSDADGVWIAVEDDGPGITEADRSNLFSPFYRGSSKTAAQVSGTGLGLAIAREIARKSGGEVVFDESCVPGCRFVVKLQVAATNSQRPVESSDAEHA